MRYYQTDSIYTRYPPPRAIVAMRERARAERGRFGVIVFNGRRFPIAAPSASYDGRVSRVLIGG